MNVEHVVLTPEEKKKFTLCMSELELAELSPGERLKYERAQVENCFGHEVKFKNGVPQEVGVGSPGNENINHVRALEAQKAGREMNEAILSAARREQNVLG
jgi:hypothetical protein